MDRGENLILHNGKDITKGVQSCVFDSQAKQYAITFPNGRIYRYSYSTIQWYRKPERLDTASIHVSYKGKELFEIRDIRVFRAGTTDYWYICCSNGYEQVYDKRCLEIEVSCLGAKNASSCLEYLRQLAAINELKGDDGEVLLQKQYEKLDFVSKNNVMASYLDPENNQLRTYQESGLIFPFGGNASQFKAVERALNNQLSVIQGPPGTGKTQTILNIIANLLIRNKTIQIVSNNNSATANVLEKLSSPKYGMAFLVAALGSSANKKAFIENQTGVYPDISSWEMKLVEQANAETRIHTLSKELSTIFVRRERLATAKSELDALLLEIKYFEQYCADTGIALYTKLRRKIKSDRLMHLWQECSFYLDKSKKIPFSFKVKSVLIYGASDWRIYDSAVSRIVTLFQSLYYQARKAELTHEISDIEIYLSSVQADDKMDELTKLSLGYLRAKLFEKYGGKGNRLCFSSEALRQNTKDVMQEYPIILSTTFSSRSCLRNAVYDYLIMDEASQVDVATGALALSGAKNAVIVGDPKQLPNVVTKDIKKRSDAVFASFNLDDGYSYTQNSFLTSICSLLSAAPQTLLREHYRCHPKIIGFCNQKFYNNELIIMTEDNGENDTLSAYRTVAGQHRRDRVNQRQIDVLFQEALPKLLDVPHDELGVIAPYRAQVSEIMAQMGSSDIEVDTVHKFQGREKDTIILTTVDDTATDFSDNPYLLNVAISRAKRRLCLVTSGNEQPTDSNIADLISYIEYNNFEVVQSEIYSVFDILYTQYTNARIAFLKKHKRISAYDSENIMFAHLTEILAQRKSLMLSIICHQPLNMLIRDPKRLNDDECRYAMNEATHLDFLIYNTVSKKPVLAIEVDGFHYHKIGTKQYDRDRMKDHVMELYGIPLMRLPTHGSGEIERIEEFLDNGHR